MSDPTPSPRWTITSIPAWVTDPVGDTSPQDILISVCVPLSEDELKIVDATLASRPEKKAKKKR